MTVQVCDLSAALVQSLVARSNRPGVLPQHHPIWIDILRRSGEDCRGLVLMDNGEPLSWLFYTIRDGPHGVVVNSMPFIAYGGPTSVESSETIVRLLETLLLHVRRTGADVLTICTSPFLAPEIETTYRQVLAPTHELENFVQIQDITVHPEASLPSRKRDPLRRNIARARRHGLRVLPDLSAEQLEAWLVMYTRRCAELGAAAYPEDFFRLIHELAVPTGAAEYWGVVEGERLVGGTLFLISGQVVDYFMPAYLTEYRDVSPNSLVLSEAFTAFVARGCRWFNWQSSPSRGQGVYEYKARWGAVESRHFYLSVLLNPSSRLLREPVSVIREAYPHRFILPYSAWKNPGDWRQKS